MLFAKVKGDSCNKRKLNFSAWRQCLKYAIFKDHFGTKETISVNDDGVDDDEDDDDYEDDGDDDDDDDDDFVHLLTMSRSVIVFKHQNHATGDDLKHQSHWKLLIHDGVRNSINALCPLLLLIIIVIMLLLLLDITESITSTYFIVKWITVLYLFLITIHKNDERLNVPLNEQMPADETSKETFSEALFDEVQKVRSKQIVQLSICAELLKNVLSCFQR